MATMQINLYENFGLQEMKENLVLRGNSYLLSFMLFFYFFSSTLSDLKLKTKSQCWL